MWLNPFPSLPIPSILESILAPIYCSAWVYTFSDYLLWFLSHHPIHLPRLGPCRLCFVHPWGAVCQCADHGANCPAVRAPWPLQQGEAASSSLHPKCHPLTHWWPSCLLIFPLFLARLRFISRYIVSFRDTWKSGVLFLQVTLISSLAYTTGPLVYVLGFPLHPTHPSKENIPPCDTYRFLDRVPPL